MFIDAHCPRPIVVIVHSNLCCSFPLQRQSHFHDFFFCDLWGTQSDYQKRSSNVTQPDINLRKFQRNVLSPDHMTSDPRIQNATLVCKRQIQNIMPGQSNRPYIFLQVCSTSNITNSEVLQWMTQIFLPSTMLQCIADSVHWVQWTMQGIKYWTQQKSLAGKTDRPTCMVTTKFYGCSDNTMAVPVSNLCMKTFLRRLIVVAW